MNAVTTHGWQPIDTAPKHNYGEEILVYDALDYSCRGIVWCVGWIDGKWMEGGDQGQEMDPEGWTHWMPLPDPPASELAKIEKDAA